MSKPATKSEPTWGRFQQASRDDRYRMLWSSQGPGGAGKTHFGLTAPDPIAVQLFDPAGLEGLTRQSLFRDKDIRVIEYKFNPVAIPKEDRPKVAEDTLGEFLEDFTTGIKLGRTILWDKEDYVWELMRYASFDAFTDKPANYYELNLQYRNLFQLAADNGVNFGVIRGMKEKWGKTGTNRQTGAATYGGLGIDVPRGMKEVPELVQVNLAHEWVEGDGFKIKILEKCRLNGDLVGQEFGSLTFTDLALALYPESAPEDWA